MRVVLDTNVLVSGLAYLGDPPGRLVNAWRAGAFSLALSDFLLYELARILPALSTRTGFTSTDVRDFLDLLRATASVVELDADVLRKAQGSGLRDPNDLPILATLFASGADCLISGDKDVLALAEHHPILKPADFCTRHGL